MSQNPISERSLFHYTTTIDNLKGILLNGFQARFRIEDISWIPQDKSHMAYPMVCFCDIPLSDIRNTEHLKRYGEFGIGMSRRWAKELKKTHNGVMNPVHYIVSGEKESKCIMREQIQLLSQISGVMEKNIDKGKINHEDLDFSYQDNTGIHKINAYSAMPEIVYSITSHLQLVSGEKEDEYFYSAREWRYIHWYESDDAKTEQLSMSTGKYPKEELKELAKSINGGKPHEGLHIEELKFNAADVDYIFVKDSVGRNKLIEFIYQDAGMQSKYHLSDRLNLISKIGVLDTILRQI